MQEKSWYEKKLKQNWECFVKKNVPIDYKKKMSKYR